MGPPGGNKGPPVPSSSNFPQTRSNQQRTDGSYPQTERRPVDRDPDVRLRPINQTIPQPETVLPRHPQPGRVSPFPTEHDELPAHDTDTGGDRVDGRHHRTHLDVNVRYSSTEEEVRQSTPDILTSFIVNRMQNDGYDVPAPLSQRQQRVQK